MTYQEALHFIHGIQRFGSKPGLRRVRMLLERMGNPQDTLRFIHVAGTNGKGSTCAMLSHVLTEAGYRTGLYISPFVIDFRERIQINNAMIPQEDLAESTARVKAHWDALNAIDETPTEFEVVVAVAMDYFSRQTCDVVVLEVGMGGRFDATNVIKTPLCSVITSIGVDHTEYLGDTLANIAFEKCGIIKPGGVTVCYPRMEPEALEVVMRQCAEKGNRLILPANAEILRANMEGSDVRYGDLELHIPLGGEHQVWNTLTVLEALKACALSGVAVKPEEIVRGIAATRFPSRLEILGRKPLVLLDGAHNLSGARALREAMKMAPGNIHAVIGMMADKDVDGVAEAIAPLCKSVACVCPDTPRALKTAELAAKMAPYCNTVYECASAGEGFLAARNRCGEGDTCLVCGSLYLAAELRPLLLRECGQNTQM